MDNVHARKPANKTNSNSRERILSRLKRDAADSDCPRQAKAREALDGIESGAITSARQAGIRAGIVRVPTGLETLRKAWARATEEERAEFGSEGEEVARLRE